MPSLLACYRWPVGSVASSLVSEAEFLRLPETTEKVELLDGEVIVSPSPNYWHQEVLARIVGSLRRWADAQSGPVTVGPSPLDVRFADSRILQPDAFVLRERIARTHQGPITSIPVVCVEVLSGNRAYDRVTKRFVYAQSGLAEYWVIEPQGFVEQWSGPDLAHRAEVTDVLCSAQLPEFALPIAELFR